MSTSTLRPPAERLFAHAKPITVGDLPAPWLVLVPHADDETLGLGGLLAQGFDAGVEVDLLLMTDGTGSHPNAVEYTAERRRATREAELAEAIDRLGGKNARLQFWRKPDTNLPTPDDTEALASLAGMLTQKPYGTVLTPWRDDPHGDHRATTALLYAALAERTTKPRIIEYAVWLGHQGSEEDYPSTSEVKVYELDVREQIPAKRHALKAHASQLGQVFDDVDGFVVPDALHATVDLPVEYFFESIRQLS